MPGSEHDGGNCNCEHKHRCPEAKGKIKVNVRRPLGLVPSGYDPGPRIWRAIHQIGHGRCTECGHTRGCPERANEHR